MTKASKSLPWISWIRQEKRIACPTILIKELFLVNTVCINPLVKLGSYAKGPVLILHSISKCYLTMELLIYFFKFSAVFEFCIDLFCFNGHFFFHDSFIGMGIYSFTSHFPTIPHCLVLSNNRKSIILLCRYHDNVGITSSWKSNTLFSRYI